MICGGRAFMLQMEMVHTARAFTLGAVVPAPQ